MKKTSIYLILFFLFSKAIGAAPEVIGSIDQLRLIEGFTPYTSDLKEVFNDPDGQPLSYQAQLYWDDVIAVSFDSDQMTIAHTSGLGVAWVKLTANDPDGASASISFIVQVTEENNHDPVLDSAILNVTAYYSPTALDPGFYKEVNVGENFSDPDGDELTFDGDNQSGIVTVTSDNATIQADGIAGGGDFDITVRATDGRGGIALDTFKIYTVSDFANAFILNPVPDQYLQVGFEEKIIDLSNVLFYGSIDLPDGAAVSVEDESVVTAVVDILVNDELTIKEVGSGSTEATITFQYPGYTVETTFAIWVNNPPELSEEITDVSLVKGFESYSIDLSSTFTDPDSDELTYSAASSDEDIIKALMDGQTLKLEEVGLGQANVQIVVQDDKEGEATINFDVTVQDIPLATTDKRSWIYPNPFRNQISLKGFQGVTGFILYDANGSMIQQYPGTEETLLLNNLQKGIYYLKVVTSNSFKMVRLLKE